MASSEPKVQRGSVAKQSKETGAKARAAEKKKARALDAKVGKDEPLSPAAQARLSEIVAQVVSMHRRTTAQVFAMGECLAEAKSIQPQKGYGRWLKENCRYSVRSAWSFISVHERLGDHRVRLEKHALGATALFELAKGEPDQVEAVLDQFDEGKHLTGTEIKAIVGKKEETAEDADPTQMGGKSGLQKMVAAKSKSSMAEFLRLTAAVLVGVEKAIARFNGGKRIVMTTLADDVQTNARHASDLFIDIAVPLHLVDYRPQGNLSHVKLDMQTGWGAIQYALYQLGGAGSWPARDEMEKWVVEVAHPVLRFAVHGEPYVMSSKPADATTSIAVAGADRGIRDNDEIVLEPDDQADEMNPGMTNGDMDAALNSLIAETSAPIARNVSR